ncbi:hypothetical protein PMIN01_00807 [Paraphaeosphaeria minitans]|uniref:Secreted protein n=1 Tax=Paraphaeosphaeria minitans TaxID=565426 RepID=A0A9P6GU26_9PLEO|nr:hypothetical protein PMIN01_00807 [Paraphaeosphaeria minitans]
MSRPTLCTALYGLALLGWWSCRPLRESSELSGSRGQIHKDKAQTGMHFATPLRGRAWFRSRSETGASDTGASDTGASDTGASDTGSRKSMIWKEACLSRRNCAMKTRPAVGMAPSAQLGIVSKTTRCHVLTVQPG